MVKNVADGNACSYNDCVRIDVGTGESVQSFNVHTALLTARSLFFKKALTGNWKEAEERVVKLSEDTPPAFATYVHHLYTGELAVQPDIPELWTMVHNAHRNLCHLYVLAERLQDIQTKNAIISSIFEICREKQSDGRCCYPDKVAISIIYNGTAPGSHAR